MCSIEHILERRVDVIRFRSRGRAGEERRRVQKLVEVMGLGLITCGEAEDVVGALTPVVGGVAQVFHDLLVELQLLLVAECLSEDAVRRNQTIYLWMRL